jgi:hypothetical protein
MTRAPIHLETSPRVAASTERVALRPTLSDNATHPVLPSGRHRQISPPSGKALELLGHAIEYLTDEYVLHAGSIPSLYVGDPQVRAIGILMAASRSVYFDCPLAPTLLERLSGLLSRAMHSLQLPKHNQTKTKIRR